MVFCSSTISLFYLAHFIRKKEVIEINIIDHKCHLPAVSFWLSILCFDAHLMSSMTVVGQS